MSISKSLSGFVRTRARNAQHNLRIGTRYRIMSILDDTRFTHRQMDTEKKACNRIVEALEELGRVTQQHVIEKGARVDIAVGDEQEYGIEVKLLKALQPMHKRNELHGQLKRYCARYDCNLMLIVVGRENEESNSIVEELANWSDDLNVDFYYLPTYSA